MRVLLVEDDHDQADFIKGFLGQELAGSEIELIRTEHEFRGRLDAIAERPPDVVVMDVMLRWTDPSPAMEPRPQDVKEGGIFEAGLRCRAQLADRPATAAVPVILYTVLERDDLDAKYQAMHLGKEADSESLVHAIRSLTRRP